VKLHVERNGNGPHLVLLHGWGLHSGVWSELLPALAARHRVHAIDLPGHGYSAAIPVPSFDEAVDEVAALVPEQSLVCGWSLGGLVAQRLARLRAGKVRALALVATTPCFVERADWPHAMKSTTLEAFAAGLRKDRDATLENFVRLNALHGTRSREAIRAFTRRLEDRGAPSAAALGATLQWLREVDLRPDAATLDMPALVIHGARDALASIAAGRWLAANLPRAELHELPDAAHLPFFTHRDLFVKTLESFVA
jgi:pimeloyl-[acyl-carrier protein] methyl ester esterase